MSTAKRVTILLIGGTLLLVGLAMLVLPGPGLLMVLAGLLVLSTEFPAVDRYIDPIQKRAMHAAEESVASPLRLTGSVLAGVALIGTGVLWGVNRWLGGWAAGTGLIVSGLVLLGLMVYSYERLQRKRRFGRIR